MKQISSIVGVESAIIRHIRKVAFGETVNVSIFESNWKINGLVIFGENFFNPSFHDSEILFVIDSLGFWLIINDIRDFTYFLLIFI